MVTLRWWINYFALTEYTVTSWLTLLAKQTFQVNGAPKLLLDFAWDSPPSEAVSHGLETLRALGLCLCHESLLKSFTGATLILEDNARLLVFIIPPKIVGCASQLSSQVCLCSLHQPAINISTWV